MNYSVWEVMRYPNLAHLDPQLFPRILEDRNGKIVIETIHIVPYICDSTQSEIDPQTKREVLTKVQKPGYAGVWLVFDWDNKLKPDCLTGKCEVSKVDSIAFIKIAYPCMNDYTIEYFMDLCTPINKYMINARTFNFARNDVAHSFSNITCDTETRLIQYNEMLANPEYAIPADVQEILRKENLIGGVIYARKDGARKIDCTGKYHGSKNIGQIIEKGLLQKIQF